MRHRAVQIRRYVNGIAKPSRINNLKVHIGTLVLGESKHFRHDVCLKVFIKIDIYYKRKGARLYGLNDGNKQ